jgi:DNA-binding FadR family transcriptional regulator
VSSVDPIRVPKTGEVVARSIRSRIVSGELPEGSFLPPEAELMQQFRISRPTLREAFRILESEQLIHLRRGARNGAEVLAPKREVAARFAGLVLQASGASLADVLAARLLLFPPATRMLAESHEPADLEILRRLIDRLEGLAEDPPAFLRLATDFNLTIVELTRSPTLLLLAGMLDDIIDQAGMTVVGQWTSRPAARADQTAAVVAAMRRLVDLVESGDGRATQDFWHAEMEASSKYTLRVVGTKTVLDLFE